MAVKDYYEVLGVAQTADGNVIKKAYRKLAMRYHPDRQNGVSKAAAQRAEETFKEVKEAYETLSDTGRRAAYDRQGHTAFSQDDLFTQPRPGAGGPFPGKRTPDPDFARMFEDLMDEMKRADSFRDAAQQARAPLPVGDNIEMTLELTLDDALAGCTRTVKVHVAQPCPKCHGSGARCARCQGVGQVFNDHRWEVRIPPGTLNGARLRLKGAGHDGPRFSGPGALFITVEWVPHPVWRPAEAGEPGDLERDLRLTPEQARRGATLPLKTLDGKQGEITVPAGSTNGRRLRLKNQGWPMGPERGDAFLVLTVDAGETAAPTASDAPASRSAWVRWAERWSRPGATRKDPSV